MAKSELKKIPSISTKTIGYSAKEIRKLVDGKQEQVFLARFGGVVLEAFAGSSKHGDWTGFKGIFACATRDETTFTSSVIFLPANVTKKVMDQLSQGVVEVEFKADIYVVESDKNASGYAFMCEPVLSEEANRKAEAVTSIVLKGKLPTLLLAAPAKKTA